MKKSYFNVKRFLKRKKVLLVLSLAVFLVGLFGVRYIFPGSFVGSITENVIEAFGLESVEKAVGEGRMIELNFDTLPLYLMSNEMIKDLPSEGEIALTMGVHEYIIRKGSVVKGRAGNPDINVWLEPGYLGSFAVKGFCPTLSEAYGNGGMGIEPMISNTKLFWKYKGVLRYKNCLGL